MRPFKRTILLSQHLSQTVNPYIPAASFATMTSNLTLDSKYRMKSGHEIPILGYGVYQTPSSDASSVVQHAMKTGYRHVDSAAVYRNEQPSAEGMLAAGLPRDQIFFTSKVPHSAMSYKDAKRVIDETIKKINPPAQRGQGLSYVDLMLLHAPFGGPTGRIGAWQALVEAVEEGKVRSIGVSNYGVHHLDELEQWMKKTEAEKGKGKAGILSVNQVELHPWITRPDIVDWCEKRGVLLEAYSPLVRAERMSEPALVELAKKHGKTQAQILIRWSLQKV